MTQDNVIAKAFADAKPYLPPPPEIHPEDMGRGHLKALLSLLADIKLKLVLDSGGEIYAFFSQGGHFEVHRLHGNTFKQRLAAMYFQAVQKGISPNVMSELLAALSGRAHSEHNVTNISVRLGGTRECVLIDLCNKSWQILEITQDGYAVKPSTTPTFQRFAGMQPLPCPKEDGDFEAIWELCNLNDPEARMLVEAWLVTALIPQMHVPLLVLNGEQGSAKSTTTKLLKNILDPHDAPLKSLPTSERDLFISAARSRVLAFDNVSGFGKDMSDALCKLITGGAYSNRTLYSDQDETIIKGHCVVIMNGIPDFLTRGDLIDRSLVIQLSPIDRKQRKDDTAFEKMFQRCHPAIFGGLVGKVRQVIGLLPSIQAEEHAMPRMISYAQVGLALERLNNWPAGSFLEAYNINLKGMNRKSLDASLVASKLIQFMRTRGTWSGTATGLLEQLSNLGEKPAGWQHHWPQTAHRLSQELKRLRPALETEGITIDTHRSSSERTLTICNSVIGVTSDII